MDSIVQNPLVIDPAGTGNGIQNALVLVPKSEPIDEFPPGFGYPMRRNSHFITDLRRRKMPLSGTERSRITELIRCKLGLRESASEMLLHADNYLSAEILQSLLDNDKRSSELARASIPEGLSDKYYLNVIRYTRMLYCSLLSHLVACREVKQRNLPVKPLIFRGDLKAAKFMRQNGFWLHCNRRLVGEIPGIQVGEVFLYRIELCVVGLHGWADGRIDFVPWSQYFNGDPIATSVVIKDCYEDGDVIVYQSKGGKFGNQKLEGGILALERSMHYGIEIRVIRKIDTSGNPTTRLYIYDGLYKIDKTWFDIGESKFGVYKFKLIRMENQPVKGTSIFKFANSLKRNVLPDRYISVDISQGEENQQVRLFNKVDDDKEPVFYTYIPKAIIPSFQNRGLPCGCVSNCSYNCPCSKMNRSEYVYDKFGNLVRGKEIVFECGSRCGCPPSCRNRSTNSGLNKTFEVFRTIDKKWGVRCLDLILPGAFVCEFAGIPMDMEEGRVVASNGAVKLLYSKQFEKSWMKWGNDLSNVKSKYAQIAYPSMGVPDWALNVSSSRNLAFYIRHSSSSSNVFVQRVANADFDIAFPRLMIFANQIIPPMREIILDYGIFNPRKNQKMLKIEN